MFLKGGEICKGVKFNSAYFQGEFALIVLALLHFACIQGEFAPQLCFEFELCAFCYRFLPLCLGYVESFASFFEGPRHFLVVTGMKLCLCGSGCLLGHVSSRWYMQ